MSEAPPNREAWVSAALGRFEGPLLRYTAQIVGDCDQAQDVVQDAFLRLWSENPERLNGCLAEWLYTVCRNRAIDLRRKSNRHQPFVEGWEPPCDGQVSPAEAMERRDSSQAVLDFLTALPAKQQEVIRLKFEHGLSYQEISQITGLSVSNVGFLIHTGIKSLRDEMKKLEWRKPRVLKQTE
jgi:RNA polymerase sigma-70 factor (ECF subfamily)